jgi:putative membrane protein insertion efficiency factor
LNELASYLKPLTLEYLPSDYSDEPRLRDLPRTVWNWPRMVLLGLIRLYQMTLAKTLPPNTCRFYPSCSHYGYQAVYKFGVLKGGAKAIWRVLRCNPFNPGGYDPVV